MKGLHQTELVISAFSLLIAFIIVHVVYVAVIRPRAEDFLAQEKIDKASDENYKSQRSVYVVLRDFEQEACFVMMLWASSILGFKLRRGSHQQKQLDRDFIGTVEESGIAVADAKQIADRLRQLPDNFREFLLPRVLLSALERFSSTRKIENASMEVKNLCEEEAGRLDSELSIIRYIAWAIPSVGFIGTVRGIGDALAQADQAVSGDISGVTTSLGVAFNSTFVALLISIVLMFIIHQVQLGQERLVLNTQRYCNKWLIDRLVI